MKTILNFDFKTATLLPPSGSERRMIVCHCQAVNDRAIREAIRRGARSPREVALACRAGRRCGGCIPVVRELLCGEATRDEAAPESLPVVAAG